MPGPARGPRRRPAAPFHRPARPTPTAGSAPGAEKEELFGKAVPLIDPYARVRSMRFNQGLLLGTGEVTGTGVRPQSAGGIRGRVDPDLAAPAGGGHRAGNLARPLRHRVPSPAPAQSGTTGDWPLNVFDEATGSRPSSDAAGHGSSRLAQPRLQLGGERPE